MGYPSAFLVMALAVAASGSWDPDLTDMAKLIRMNTFRMEEKIRTDGSSGLKQQRGHVVGSEAWYQPSHTSYTIMAIHDHPDYQGMIGMGEAAFVLNGVEFRTRHNDYYMMRRGDKKGDPLSHIIPPPVPDSVLNQPTVEKQIAEMKEYFRAFHTQNTTHRPYTKYFKPVLCYLEGSWSTKIEGLQEAFPSDRHFFDATSWEDLQSKIRYNAYTGRKNRLENFSFQPRSIYNISADGKPEYAQWMYTIMCHKLKTSMPLHRLKQEDDLQARFVNRKTFSEFASTRGVRYRLERDKDDDRGRVTFLDHVMAEVPGKDGYDAVIHEQTLGDEYTSLLNDNQELLNAARYNRVYGSKKADALGRQDSKRGYSDPELFVAYNTDPDTVDMDIKICEKDGTCFDDTKRVSYAIPLEIIYLNPLMSWNPYNIPEIEELKNLKRVNNAYNGWNKQKFYRTPAEFFTGGDSGGDPADTGADPLDVLDGNGNAVKVVPSGVYVFLPNIEGIGRIRQRYPVVPIHGEGSSTWKEINALKEIVMEMKSNKRFLREDFLGSMKGNQDSNIVLQTYIDRNKMLKYGGDHVHFITVSMEQRAKMRESPDNTIRYTTSCFRFESINHNHDVEIHYSGGRFVVKSVYVDGVAKDPTLNTTWHHDTKKYLRTFARSKYNGDMIFEEKPTV